MKKPLDPNEAYEVMSQLAERARQQGGLTHREVIEALVVGIITFEQVRRQARDDALRHALEGDWALMAEYIREGGRLTSEMRPFLADVLDGRIVRPAKKISKAKTVQRNRELAHFVLEARQRGGKDIPRKTEEKFGRTWRQLQKNLASVDKMEILEDQGYLSSLSQVAGFKTEPPDEEGVNPAAVLFHPHATLSPSKSVRARRLLAVSDMALTPHTLT